MRASIHWTIPVRDSEGNPLRSIRAEPAPTREAWLLRAGACTAAMLTDAAGLRVPDHYVSVGFPRGGTSRWRHFGQCWDGARSRDQRPHLFVSPELSEPPRVLAVLLHEQIHAAVGPQAGHRGGFVRAARAVGFVRPWTHALTGNDLTKRLYALGSQLGPYPHAALKPASPERPGSRLRLWECACPVKVRVASDTFAAHCDDCRTPFVRQRA